MPCTEGHRSQNRTLQRCETSIGTAQSVSAGDGQRDSRLALAGQTSASLSARGSCRLDVADACSHAGRCMGYRRALSLAHPDTTRPETINVGQPQWTPEATQTKTSRDWSGSRQVSQIARDAQVQYPR